MKLIDFQVIIFQRLIQWSFVSVFSGILMRRNTDPFWKGLGIQFTAWGIADALIAFVGFVATRRRIIHDHMDQSVHKQREVIQAGKLSRLLWINSLLDIFYMAGGIAVIRKRGRQDRFWSGHGWGILVQGGFLFFFDLIHARFVSGAGYKN